MSERVSAEDGPRVTRKDFVRRSRVILKCDRCGTTTITCDIDTADLYESGLREHVCGQPVDLTAHPNFRRLLLTLMGEASTSVIPPANPAPTTEGGA